MNDGYAKLAYLLKTSLHQIFREHVPVEKQD